MKFQILIILMLAVFFQSSPIIAQSSDSETGNFTLEQCIDYALSNKPAVKQARIDESIGDRQIKAQLSAWLPQVSAQFNANHNIKKQTTAFGDQIITIGTSYTSNLLLQANQTIYSNDVFLASRASRYARLQLDQNTSETKINTVVDVSKAYYDILLTNEQLTIIAENINRLEKQYKNAYSRFENGLVDKTDYQRASITLANSLSDKKRASEMLNAKYAYLKQLLGYPVDEKINLVYDRNELMNQEILIDTTQTVSYNQRIELQQLETQKQLLKLNTSYYRWGFLPEISAFYNYNYNYLNDEFSELYTNSFPASVIGLSANLPIFQGTRRIQNVKIAQLEEERLEIDVQNTQSIINTEFQTALASYKSDYNDWITLKKNMEVAEEVYNIIKLQYDEGIKTYLELIVAETDLRTAQINYFNSLYQVLASKLDYQRALGVIDIQ